MRAEGTLDYVVRWDGEWALSEEDQDRFVKELDSIDICGTNVECLAKLNYCLISAKKYDKVLRAYLRGVNFDNCNYTVSGLDDLGLTPNRYEDKGITKFYISFQANEKKSKRFLIA
jgi:hypothetical protein